MDCIFCILHFAFLSFPAVKPEQRTMGRMIVDYGVYGGKLSMYGVLCTVDVDVW